MNNMYRKPILITGAHRSGTTWLGRIVSKAPNVRYIHEPFNVGIENPQRPFGKWFQHISKNSDPDLQRKTLTFVQSFYTPSLNHLYKSLNFTKGLRSNYRAANDYLRRFNHRPLIKDPIAVMSAPWLHQQLNCDVIITVRHPAAFVDSIITHNWPFPYDHFMEQKHLMQDHLSDYRTEITDFAAHKKPLIEQAILLWNIIYSMVLKYEHQYANEWYFVKHEDLSVNPVPEFQQLFSFLNLEFAEAVKDAIVASTTAKHESDLSRDSKKNISKWKRKLSENEVLLIKEGTRSVWEHFYDESDW
jgi:hypothetical protein